MSYSIELNYKPTSWNYIQTTPEENLKDKLIRINATPGCSTISQNIISEVRITNEFLTILKGSVEDVHGLFSQEVNNYRQILDAFILFSIRPDITEEQIIQVHSEYIRNKNSIYYNPYLSLDNQHIIKPYLWFYSQLKRKGYLRCIQSVKDYLFENTFIDREIQLIWLQSFFNYNEMSDFDKLFNIIFPHKIDKNDIEMVLSFCKGGSYSFVQAIVERLINGGKLELQDPNFISELKNIFINHNFLPSEYDFFHFLLQKKIISFNNLIFPRYYYSYWRMLSKLLKDYQLTETDVKDIVLEISKFPADLSHTIYMEEEIILFMTNLFQLEIISKEQIDLYIFPQEHFCLEFFYKHIHPTVNITFLIKLLHFKIKRTSQDSIMKNIISRENELTIEDRLLLISKSITHLSLSPLHLSFLNTMLFSGDLFNKVWNISSNGQQNNIIEWFEYALNCKHFNPTLLDIVDRHFSFIQSQKEKFVIKNKFINYLLKR